MIYAMHQATLACVIRHAEGSAWHAAMLRRVAREQLLLASSTTEGSAGGNVRTSEAPVVRDGKAITLERAATVISYGEQADGVVTTARRAPDADPTDQSLVVLMRDDYSLERTMSWDTLGMRGTCSAGFTLRARAEAVQVMPQPYSVIHSQSMAPNAHLLWSGVWAGIAAGATDRARRFVRKAARGSDGVLPPGAPHFTKATASLRGLRALIAASVGHYEAVKDDPAALTSVEFQTDLSLLKVDASDLAVSTVLSALRACGLSGYRNDTDVTIGRLLRDVLSGPIMINNDRILANVATSALVAAVPMSVRD
jgi:acyl-CoA dehydrogenase